ncbi:MAG: LON peptidase substrate-binding domain-containing protein [Candidatus Velthaea sp.]
MAAPSRLRLFPLNTVLFPGAVLNLHVFEPRYRQLVAECLEADEAFGVVLIREGREAGETDVLPHDVGTTAEICDVTRLPAGRYYITTTGRRRFRIRKVVRNEPYLLVDVDYLDEHTPPGVNLGSLHDEVCDEFREYLRLLVEFSGTAADIDVPADPVDVSFLIGDAIQVADEMKQRLLEISDTGERLETELDYLRRSLPQLRQLLERKAAQAPVERDDAPGGTFRTHQEQFFGKHFSLN